MFEGYIWDEWLGFIIEYWQRFEIMKWPIWNVDEGNVGEVLEGAGTKFFMSPGLHDVTHQYVLINTPIMMPWM